MLCSEAESTDWLPTGAAQVKVAAKHTVIPNDNVVRDHPV
jgi:hypothetical protein